MGSWSCREGRGEPGRFKARVSMEIVGKVEVKRNSERKRGSHSRTSIGFMIVINRNHDPRLYGWRLC